MNTYTIRKETRENPHDSLWPDYPTKKNYDVFVRDHSPKGDVLEVDCDFITRKYGSATVKNARKFFDYRDSVHDLEEAEELECQCVGQVIMD